MGAGHAHRLYLPGASPVHRLPPHPKIVAVLAFVLLVVATPRERMWAFGDEDDKKPPVAAPGA